MQGREVSMQTSLQAIANKAASQPGYRFRNLYGMLNEGMLKDSWQHIRKDAAYGVDRVSAKDYEQNLDENIHQLVEGLKQKRYRATRPQAVHSEREWQDPPAGDTGHPGQVTTTGRQTHPGSNL